MSEPLANLLSRAEERVLHARESLARAKSDLETVQKVWPKRDGKWVSVKEVLLRLGARYVVRRTFGESKTAREPWEPAIAVWSESGWVTLYGDIPACTAQGAGIQVWV